MARHEADREDLFEEFRSAVHKWELRQPDLEDVWMTGVRKDGRFSLYCGPDPCYHFDSSGRLLRAFVNGALYRTQGATLAQMVRRRTSTETQLLRHDLTLSEVDEFRVRMQAIIESLVLAIQQSEVDVLRVESDADLPTIILPRLQQILDSQCEFAPAYPTRRQ